MATTSTTVTRSKKRINPGASEDTVAPTALLADKKMALELEKAKMKIESQAQRIEDLSSERDYLKEQLAAALRRTESPSSSKSRDSPRASRRQHSPRSPSPLQDISLDVQKISSDSDGSLKDLSISSDSSDGDHRQKKKKGKKHPKSKKLSTAPQRGRFSGSIEEEEQWVLLSGGAVLTAILWPPPLQ
ncbi:hypothetical protein WMY93_001956 [Mugilogobius chulae]|uniref:Uncharacterized protein n=1 Tax=Mugilogobius chulae TaxID=88201 RepID=A0AAW0Q0R4_9GOBI